MAGVMRTTIAGLAALAAAALAPVAAVRADEPNLIFRKTTEWLLLAPDATLNTFGLDDPIVDGVACHFTVPQKGGWKGWLGLAEELSLSSLACRQVGPISFKEKFEQGEEMFRQRRSLVFKKMRIVRGCDTKRNVLVYVTYTDRLISGSPESSTSTVPIMPWGAVPPVKCADWVK